MALLNYSPNKNSVTTNSIEKINNLLSRISLVTAQIFQILNSHLQPLFFNSLVLRMAVSL